MAYIIHQATRMMPKNPSQRAGRTMPDITDFALPGGLASCLAYSQKMTIPPGFATVFLLCNGRCCISVHLLLPCCCPPVCPLLSGPGLLVPLRHRVHAGTERIICALSAGRAQWRCGQPVGNHCCPGSDALARCVHAESACVTAQPCESSCDVAAGFVRVPSTQTKDLYP